MIESADITTYFWYALGFFTASFVPAVWLTQLKIGLEKIT